MMVLDRWDIGEKLDEFGEPDMSGAVRPMALALDERTLFFQVSFHRQYLLDSAHHGLAIDPTGEKLCAAGTTSDYTAIVDRETFMPRLASYGEKPYWATTGPTGAHCWVSYSGDDQVAVIDYETEREIALGRRTRRPFPGATPPMSGQERPVRRSGR